MSTRPCTVPAALRAGRSLLRVRAALRTAAIIVSALLLPLAGAAAQSNESSPKGGLFFKTSKPGVYYEAPLVDTDVALAVTGTILRATVRQHFVNPSSAWLEGVYVFPLPERAAVDHLVMEIGDRHVVGQIKERQEAKAVYEQAAANGQHASLVESERPNIFTTSVANIGPGEAITVEIQYQDSVNVDAGTYSLRFPMVVGPRYIPGGPIAQVSANPDQRTSEPGTGWAANTDRVPDASRITPPVLQPGQGKINPVRLTVDFAPGFATERVTSLYHPVIVAAKDDGASHRRAQPSPQPPASGAFGHHLARRRYDDADGGAVLHRDGVPVIVATFLQVADLIVAGGLDLAFGLVGRRAVDLVAGRASRPGRRGGEHDHGRQRVDSCFPVHVDPHLRRVVSNGRRAGFGEAHPSGREFSVCAGGTPLAQVRSAKFSIHADFGLREAAKVPIMFGSGLPRCGGRGCRRTAKVGNSRVNFPLHGVL